MNEFSHLEEALNIDNDEDLLTKLSNLGVEYEELDAEIKEKETELKLLTQRKTFMSQTSIPEIMLQTNFKSVTLGSGKKLSVAQEVSPTLVNPEAFFDFVNARGDGQLMKTTFEVGKIPKEIVSHILKMLHTTFDLKATWKVTAHNQTLKKYIKDLCGFSDKPVEIPLSELDEEVIKVHVYYKTTLKK